MLTFADELADGTQARQTCCVCLISVGLLPSGKMIDYTTIVRHWSDGEDRRFHFCGVCWTAPGGGLASYYKPERAELPHPHAGGSDVCSVCGKDLFNMIHSKVGAALAAEGRWTP